MVGFNSTDHRKAFEAPRVDLAGKQLPLAFLPPAYSLASGPNGTIWDYGRNYKRSTARVRMSMY